MNKNLDQLLKKYAEGGSVTDKPSAYNHNSLAYLLGQGDEVMYADDTSAKKYPNEIHNGRADALRHMLWQAKLQQAYGDIPARLSGKLHEAFAGSQPEAESEMDLHNNEIGLRLGKENQTDAEILRKAIEAIDSGEAHVLHGKQQEVMYAEGGSVEYNPSIIDQIIDDTHKELGTGRYAAGGSVENKMQAIPQNENLAALAEALSQGRDIANKVDIPYLGGVGDLLVGKTPEEIENWSYANAPMQIPEMSNLPQFKKDRGESFADAATTLLPLAKGTKDVPAGLSFIGPNSKGWDKVAAELAAKKLDEGVDPEQVWQEHLIGRLPSGHLFSEISDAPLSVRSKNFNDPYGSYGIDSNKHTNFDEVQDLLDEGYPEKTIHKMNGWARPQGGEWMPPLDRPLEQKLIEHDPLSELYDFHTLKTRGRLSEAPLSSGHFNSQKNEIVIDADPDNKGMLQNTRGARSVAAHELQHAIQGMEGWPQGGSPQEFKDEYSKNRERLDSFENEPEIKKIYNKYDKFINEILDDTTDINDAELKIKDYEQELIRNYPKFAERQQVLKNLKSSDKTGIKPYRRLTGEAQARATQDRLDMDMAQRRESYPLAGDKLSDISLKDLIDKYEGDGPAFSIEDPQSTVDAYKLFRTKENDADTLYPLFVNANKPVPRDEWVKAEAGLPATDNTGRVKSKLGPLAYRPGWHAGDVPVATHIGKGGKPPVYRPYEHTWAGVEFPNDVDWQTLANERGINKKGVAVPKFSHITDQIPEGGFYRYKTSPSMTGQWLIGGDMKVGKNLTDEQVQAITAASGLGVEDLPRFKEYLNRNIDNQEELNRVINSAAGKDEYYQILKNTQDNEIDDLLKKYQLSTDDAALKALEKKYNKYLKTNDTPGYAGGGAVVKGIKKLAKNLNEALLGKHLAGETLTPDEMIKYEKNALKMEDPNTQHYNVENAMAQPEREAHKAAHDVDFLHGTNRLDRLLSTIGLDPKRAISGPMGFGTDAPPIASNYAIGKKDTSIMDNDDWNYSHAYTVLPKDLGQRGSRPYTVEQSWNYLSPEAKKDILSKASRVGHSDIDEGAGDLMLHPEAQDSINKSHFDYLLKEHRNNPLAALRDYWVDSGNLYDEEQKLEDIYKLAGYPHPISQDTAPWASAPGVLLGRSRITNPLDTSNISDLQEKVIPALKDAFKNDRSRLKLGVDQWDKNSKFTPQEWVNELESDVNKGENSFVFTSIPDKVTAALKDIGYNGIYDMGGKGGGASHQVTIPFEPSQIRSRFAAFDPLRKASPSLLASVLGGTALSDLALKYEDKAQDSGDQYYADGGSVNDDPVSESSAMDDYAQLLEGYPNASKFLSSLKNSVMQHIPESSVYSSPEEMLDYGMSITPMGIGSIGSKTSQLGKIGASREKKAITEPEEGVKIGQRISTANPTPIVAEQIGFHSTPEYVITGDMMRSNPAAFEKNMQLMSEYMPSRKRAADARYDDYKNQISGNLQYLGIVAPEKFLERSGNWYKGANALANDMANAYDIPVESAAGVLARLSPGMDWMQNVEQADRLADIWRHHQNTIMPAGSLQGTRLQDMPNASEKAAWIRAFDQETTPGHFYGLTPEGALTDIQRTMKGEPKSLMWQSNQNLLRAVNMLEDPSLENISRNMGLSGHKIRNFYNNMVDPFHPEDVTIDTHAVSAGLLTPYSQKGIPVGHAFGGGAIPGVVEGSAKSGMSSGMYGLYADAYRDAAKEMNVIPQALQSPTWELIRENFPTSGVQKDKLRQEIEDKVLKDLKKGIISLETARERILDITTKGKGLKFPAWYEK